jgi:hypothetical protein
MIDCDIRDPEGYMLTCLSPIHRMIVMHDGTLQELLSAYFGSRVNVKVNHQQEYHDVIIRNSTLHTEGAIDGTDVCTATSVISTASKTLQSIEFVDQIRKRDIGIGAILNELGVKTERELLSIGVNNFDIRRVYRIHDEVSEINIIITETFPLVLYG